MALHFGPMHSSQDGIDRVEVRIPIHLSRDDISTIVAHEFPIHSRPTKKEIFDAVATFLALHGTDGLKKPVTRTNWDERLKWADSYMRYMFRGWYREEPLAQSPLTREQAAHARESARKAGLQSKPLRDHTA